MDRDNADELWYQPDLDVYLNRWYANYEEARASRERHGGFLLPYRRHFYVCQPEVVRALGLDPEDSDWERVGFDAARPADAEAFSRLREKREAVVNSKPR